jgi:hypothetical protein
MCRGEFILCINNDPKYDNLTIGKIYRIEQVRINTTSFVDIIDDNGNINSFFRERFITMGEINKLTEVLFG